MFKTPILMLKMKFFWLIFRGKFEQKTQKSIFLKNQWRLKNIKKAMVVKNIIAEDMPFTKSIFEQFWRSYCKKTIFVVFHFLKFLPTCHTKANTTQYWNMSVYYNLQRSFFSFSASRLFLSKLCNIVKGLRDDLFSSCIVWSQTTFTSFEKDGN